MDTVACGSRPALGTKAFGRSGTTTHNPRSAPAPRLRLAVLNSVLLQTAHPQRRPLPPPSASDEPASHGLQYCPLGAGHKPGRQAVQLESQLCHGRNRSLAEGNRDREPLGFCSPAGDGSRADRSQRAGGWREQRLNGPFQDGRATSSPEVSRVSCSSVWGLLARGLWSVHAGPAA